MKDREKLSYMVQTFLNEEDLEFNNMSHSDILLEFIEYLNKRSLLAHNWNHKGSVYKERTLFLDKGESTADQKGRVVVPVRLRKEWSKELTLIFTRNNIVYAVPKEWPFIRYPVSTWLGLHIARLDCQNRLMLQIPKGKVAVYKHGSWSEFYLKFVPVKA